MYFFVYHFLFARIAYFYVFASAKFGLQANIGEEYAHFRQCEDLGSEVVFRIDDELSIESGPPLTSSKSPSRLLSNILVHCSVGMEDT